MLFLLLHTLQAYYCIGTAFGTVQWCLNMLQDTAFLWIGLKNDKIIGCLVYYYIIILRLQNLVQKSEYLEHIKNESFVQAHSQCE